MTAAFHRFPDLPAELRNAVWRAALPDDVGPSLFFYRNRGCWRVRRLNESDPEFIPVDGELEMKFRTDLLGYDNQYQVPLIFVNHEAHSLAVSWLDEHGIKIKILRPKQYIFTRPFDYDSDVLYIADDKWKDFCSEPGDRQHAADLLNRNHTIPNTVSRYAVSEKLFLQRELIEWLPEMETWLDIRAIFVVVGAQPDSESGPWRWKLEGADAGNFVWDTEKQELEFRRGVGIINEDVYRMIGEAARTNLSDQL
ncbi:hypothetical protein LEL_07720 [Akanthomyces lecanii RCEF 1005]|uniref:2EXR domain-containing protein n=1 Tax=Akanthomyces lecanii RCEF 1005 TaxID=1081108 RepID=A0A162JZE7_CORDF|nr:hypothetical protein LEL_07720 [Akanthomyces lecanii RCEF 1005]